MNEIRPKTIHGIVNRRAGSFSYQAWPTVCKNDKGELYVVYSGMRIGHICPFGKTILQKSPDGGNTWSMPVIVNDTALDDRDAGIVSLGEEKLLVTWFCHPAKMYLEDYYESIRMTGTKYESTMSMMQLETFKYLDKEEGAGGSFVRISKDNGMTFGDTIKVPVSSPHGPNALSDGTLAYLGKSMHTDKEEDEVVALYTSSDEGINWVRKSYIDVPAGYSLENFHEPHILELANGVLLGAIRCQSAPNDKDQNIFTVFTCFSYDNGNTWTVPQPTNLKGSPPHLMLHSSGAIIMSIGRREAPFGIRAVVSFDNGVTWSDEYIIRDDAPDGDLGYPATTELDDGSLITVYYMKYKGDKKTSILYTKWRL